MRVAVCHEWITTYGGSEQVAVHLADALGAEDIYAFTARTDFAQELFGPRRIHVPALGRTRLAQTRWQWFLPLMPRSWRRLDLSAFDVVVTSSHACTNAIRPPAGVPHISYCHTPMRYAWEWRSELGRIPGPLRPLWPAVAAALRRADRRWAQGVTQYIANAAFVAERIHRSYGRDAEVIHPPIDTEFWTPGDREPEDYFLFAGRLVSYKRPDVAVRAAVAAGVPMVIAGSGPELPRLRGMAGPGVRIVENPTHEELRELYRRARGFVFPGVEDFGMTLVEAQACGTPVIARGEGGALEAVVDGRTGVLYEGDRHEPLAEALRSFDRSRFSPADLRSHAEGFGTARFHRAIRAVVERVVAGGT